jgi:hypothetical protein
MFFVSGKANKESTTILGSEHPHAVQERIRGSPEVVVCLFGLPFYLSWDDSSDIRDLSGCAGE